MAGTSPAMTKNESSSDGQKQPGNTGCIFSQALRTTV
jgi:hypothetical protein